MPPIDGLDPESMALLNFYLQSQGASSLDPWSADLFGGMIDPNVNKYGELDQFGLDLQKSNLNQYQDIYGSMDDPMNALLSGLGSFGAAPLGGGVVGGGGLNPITTESILQTPATQQMMLYSQMAQQGGQATPETYIASMLSQNVMPSMIIADLQAKMADPNMDQATKNLFNSWLPQTDLQDMQGNPTGERTIDWNAAAEKIEKFASPYLTEQASLLSPNVRQNEFGQYVQYSQQPSPMQQYLTKLGLPDPKAQYGLDFAIQSDPELANLYQSIGAKGQAFDEAKKAYESYLTKYPIARRLEQMQEDREKGQRAGDVRRYADDMREYTDYMLANPEPKEPPVQARKESYEEGPSIPGWLKSAPGNFVDSITGSFSSAANPQQRPGANTVGRDIPRPAPPRMPMMPERDQQRSMFDALLGRGIRAGADRRYGMAGEMNRASRAQGDEMLAMVRALAPGYGAMTQGRSPFKDAIMQRMQPLFAVGAARG